MNDAEIQARYSRFVALLDAAVMLAAAGLANDPRNGSAMILAQSLQIAVPFAERQKPTVVIGGATGSALQAIIEAICDRSGVVAPRPSRGGAEDLRGEWLGCLVKAPRHFSAHELIAAHTLLKDTLLGWGFAPARVDYLLAFR